MQVDLNPSSRPRTASTQRLDELVRLLQVATTRVQHDPVETAPPARLSEGIVGSLGLQEAFDLDLHTAWESIGLLKVALTPVSVQTPVLPSSGLTAR